MDRRTFDSPAAVGWFMPAEWWPHTRCWMAWPTREDLWDDLLEPAKKEVAAVAQVIAEFEPVSMIASPASAKEATKACGGKIKVVALPIDVGIPSTGPGQSLAARRQVRFHRVHDATFAAFALSTLSLSGSILSLPQGSRGNGCAQAGG